MLRVSIYDPLRAQSEGETRKIGENGLIDVHSGSAHWEKQLHLELAHQRGKMLVLGQDLISLLFASNANPHIVSAQIDARHDIRNLIRGCVGMDVELFEPEFQPWGRKGSLQTFLKP